MTRFLFWTGLLAGTAMDFIAAAIIAALVGDPNYWGVFTAAFLFLLITPLVFMLWNGLKWWVFYGVAVKSRITDAYESEFIKNSFPEPFLIEDGDSYLTRVMSDTSLGATARIVAGKLLGELAAVKGTRPFTLGMLMYACIDRSIGIYRMNLIRRNGAAGHYADDD